jgi:hypothetical protein
MQRGRRRDLPEDDKIYFYTSEMDALNNINANEGLHDLLDMNDGDDNYYVIIPRNGNRLYEKCIIKYNPGQGSFIHARYPMMVNNNIQFVIDTQDNAIRAEYNNLHGMIGIDNDSNIVNEENNAIGGKRTHRKRRTNKQRTHRKRRTNKQRTHRKH